jgi:hypothetical protein
MWHWNVKDIINGATYHFIGNGENMESSSLECEDYNKSSEVDVEYVLDGRSNKSIKCWGKEKKHFTI